MNNSPADRQSPLGLFPGEPTTRLYDRLVEVPRTQHYSLRSEEAYLHWLRRLHLFHNSTHPRELAKNDYEDVQTTVVYTQVLNRGSRGVYSRWTVFEIPPAPRAAGFSGLTGQPKTGREAIGHARIRYKQSRWRRGSPPAISS
jgi:hypothetical protein